MRVASFVLCFQCNSWVVALSLSTVLSQKEVVPLKVHLPCLLHESGRPAHLRLPIPIGGMLRGASVPLNLLWRRSKN